MDPTCLSRAALPASLETRLDSSPLSSAAAAHRRNVSHSGTPTIADDIHKSSSIDIDMAVLMRRFHMHGEHIGQLNVYIKNRLSLGKPIYSKKGTHGNRWLLAELDIQSKDYQVASIQLSPNPSSVIDC